MLDLSRQYAPLRQELLDAITHVCDSQQFILGTTVSAFETSAAQATGSSKTIACASGTDALWLALAAAGIGDSTFARRSQTSPPAIITSPFTFFATASSILRAGARPLFADIDPLTFNLSAASVAEHLRTPTAANTRAILPVHLYGQCADWDAFESLARIYPGLVLLEDAAQAFGASWRSEGQPARPAGSLGLAAAFSFYPTKNLSAMGDAGLVTTSSQSLSDRLHSLRNHGMTRRYHHDEVGCNSRLDAIQAAILSVKLRHLPHWNQLRRDRAARYDQLFREAGLASASAHPTPDPTSPRTPESTPAESAVSISTSQIAVSTKDGIVLPFTDPRATHVFHQYVVRAPRRDELRDHLTAQGIGSEIYYPVPLHLQPALKDLGYRPGDFPHAERAAAEVLALPLFPELRDDEQQSVVQAIRTFYA